MSKANSIFSQGQSLQNITNNYKQLYHSGKSQKIIQHLDKENDITAFQQNDYQTQRFQKQQLQNFITINPDIQVKGAHLRSPSQGNFIFSQRPEFVSNNKTNDNTQFTETQMIDDRNIDQQDDNEIENVLIGSKQSSRPSNEESQQQDTSKMQDEKVYFLKEEQFKDLEKMLEEKDVRIKQLEDYIEQLELRIFGKTGKLELKKFELLSFQKRQKQMEILQQDEHNNSNKKKGSRPGSVQKRTQFIKKKGSVSHRESTNDLQQTIQQQQQNIIIDDEPQEISHDSYEKRDRLSQYKKMTFKQSADNSEDSNHQLKNEQSPQSQIPNLKLSKAGIPLGPGKNPLLSSRNNQAPQFSLLHQQFNNLKTSRQGSSTVRSSTNSLNQQEAAVVANHQRQSSQGKPMNSVRQSRQNLPYLDDADPCNPILEMDSPIKVEDYARNRQQPNNNGVQRSSSQFAQQFFQTSSQNFSQYGIGQYSQQNQQQQNDLNMVYLEDFDVFNEFEEKFKDFLKSTPYIEQILQTSKEYRMIIESLKILARFNDELKRICCMSEQLAVEGKKLQISETKCQEINQKNRDLRIQIKTLLKDQVAPTAPSSISDKLKQKNMQTKRELIKQRNDLIQENDNLLFKFKKLFYY